MAARNEYRFAEDADDDMEELLIFRQHTYIIEYRESVKREKQIPRQP